MITEWIGGVSVLGILGLILKNNKDYDAKISRIYKRVDEVKESEDKKFTTKDVCNERHDRISADLSEIKMDIKVLLSKIK